MATFEEVALVVSSASHVPYASVPVPFSSDVPSPSLPLPLQACLWRCALYHVNGVRVGSGTEEESHHLFVTFL